MTGVKNDGASNTTILLGWKYGIIVALIDICKAVFPVIMVQILGPYYGASEQLIHTLMYVVGFFVVIGHIFPMTMRFSGGKGTASMVGVLLVLDLRIALICIVSLLLVTFVSNYLVIGVVSMYVLFVVTTFIFDFGLYSTLIALKALGGDGNSSKRTLEFVEKSTVTNG